MQSAQWLPAAWLCPVLAACSPSAPPADLCRYIPAGTRAFALEGDPALAMDNAINTLSLDTRRHGDEKRKHCGQSLTAEAGVDDAAIVAAMQKTLGPDWQYRRDYPSHHADIRIYLWQSGGHARSVQYYALVSHQKIINPQDEPQNAIRPLETVYISE